MTYGFDGVGNRTVQALTSPAANDNFTYDTASNRLMSVARTGGATRSFSYRLISTRILIAELRRAVI